MVAASPPLPHADPAPRDPANFDPDLPHDDLTLLMELIRLLSCGIADIPSLCDALGCNEPTLLRLMDSDTFSSHMALQERTAAAALKLRAISLLPEATKVIEKYLHFGTPEVHRRCATLLIKLATPRTRPPKNAPPASPAPLARALARNLQPEGLACNSRGQSE